MKSEIPGPQSCLLVAVPLDDHTDQILEAARQLAQKTEMSLRLVHVVTAPLFGPPYNLTNLDSLESGPIFRLLEQEYTKHAEAKLEGLAQSLAPKLDRKTTCRVLLSTSIPQALASEATTCNASMILCGAGGHSYKLMPRGFSTALSLMANSPIPVLAIKPDQPCNLNEDQFRILVADDLRQAGLNAVHFALLWAQFINGASVQHVHVNSLTEDEFEAAFASALAATRSQVTEAVEPSQIYKSLEGQIRDKLEERAASLKNMVGKVRGRYEAKLITGNVSSSLAKSAEQFGAHVVVFGSHATLHRKPFGIGEVSYRAMLELPKPIMVVPM